MDVKDAVNIARQFVWNVIGDEQVSNVGLEELDFDGQEGAWRITVGFSRPWNTFTATNGAIVTKRVSRVILVRDSDGQVISMKRRKDEDE